NDIEVSVRQMMRKVSVEEPGETILVVGELLFCFQAEDGIRDDLVTGVQTCALPICDAPNALDQRGEPIRLERLGTVRQRFLGPRSEERRVGKECRYRERTRHPRRASGTRKAHPGRRQRSYLRGLPGRPRGAKLETGG